jgi:hypothetical protein
MVVTHIYHYSEHLVPSSTKTLKGKLLIFLSCVNLCSSTLEIPNHWHTFLTKHITSINEDQAKVDAERMYSMTKDQAKLSPQSLAQRSETLQESILLGYHLDP